MSRSVDFGYDRDVSLLRIAHNVRVFVLRVKSARSAADLRDTSHRRELRPRLDLDTPALIIGEMNMEHVQFVEREEIDVLLELSRCEEVTRDVEHRAAPGV